MTRSFAYPDGSFDAFSVSIFLESVDATDLPATLLALNADPTDVLTVGDLAHTTGRKEHAAVLYQWALDVLERNPSAIASDTNLSGGYYQFGKTLLELRRSADAIKPLTTCTQLSPEDATGWHMLGLATGSEGDLEGALIHLRRALQVEGVHRKQEAKFLADVRANIDLLRKELYRRELARAPEAFRRGFSLMPQDREIAARLMAQVRDPAEWEQVARCCRAYCLRELDRHAEALAELNGVSPTQLGELWEWYFHHTAAHALNMIDDLPRALNACDIAIEYSKRLQSDVEVAHFLSLKANVLKQQAFRLSTDPSTFEQGRPIIIAALECLAQSFALLPAEGRELDDELDGMARIAARMRVDEAKLAIPGVPERFMTMFRAHRERGSEPSHVDAPDYLDDAERQLRDDPFVGAVELSLRGESFATLRANQRMDEIRDLLIKALMVPSYTRKVAALALGQLGDPKAIAALEAHLATESARGQKEAAMAALLTLREMPIGSGATEAERRKAVENAYHDRPLRSAEPSPTRHLRERATAQQETGREIAVDEKPRGGFFQRLFGR
jgi:tetratricopeptide (TPR) repeat protein